MSSLATRPSNFQEHKEDQQDIEAILGTLIDVSKGGARGPADSGEIRWNGKHGALRVRMVGCHTYLVQYNVGEGANARNYLFEINLIS